MDDKTRVLEHSNPSWQSLHRVVELCSGMGALGHGSQAMGFQTMVGNDMNPKMCDLFSHHSGIPCIHGDICSNEVLYNVWRESAGARVVTAGFSCQPFSILGDRKGSSDVRSWSLPSVLAAAFLFQCLVFIYVIIPTDEVIFFRGGGSTTSQSIDWFKGKITGKSHDLHGKIWLVSGEDFPLSQPIEPVNSD